jgi:protein SCO1/2
MLKKIRIAIWAVVAIVVGYTAYASVKINNMSTSPSSQMALSDSKTPKTDNSTVSFMPVAGLKPTGAFELIDHNGDAFTQDNKAWQSPYKLIYFGFTFCPAICPTELQKMTIIMNDLPAEKAAQTQPIFISVDPERDTPDIIKQYTSMFHDRFIALTGSVEQVEHMKKIWKVFSAKVDDDSLSEYTVDHSSYIYLQGPKGNILGLFRIKDDATSITKYIDKVIP